MFGEDNRETTFGEEVEERLCYAGSHCSFGGDLLNLQRRDLRVNSCLRVGCGGLLYLLTEHWKCVECFQTSTLTLWDSLKEHKVIGNGGVMSLNCQIKSFIYCRNTVSTYQCH